MRDRDRGQAPAYWRFIADLLIGRFARRIQALEAEAERLAGRVDELKSRVAHQDGQLKMLMDLLPRTMTRAVDADGSPTSFDRRKIH